jgi:outer membrane protein assembly factor BamB
MFKKIRPCDSRAVRASVLLAATVIVAGSWGSSIRAQAGREGWPQWGGPTRDFHVAAGKIARQWPASGPHQLWRRALGEGYSSVLAEDGTLVTMYRRGDTEVIVALDAATGRTRWEHAYQAPFVHNDYADIWLNAAGPGPYSTPLIAGGTVFAVGVTGRLHALDLQTGAIRWSHDLVATFKLTDTNAFTASPLAYKDNVILTLGGSKQGVVALNRATGKLVWRSELALAPGSPVLIDVDGHMELVAWALTEFVALDPDDGRAIWRHPHPAQYGLNISTPVWQSENRLFVSSAYGGGSRMVRLSRVNAQTRAEELWFNNRMRLHFGSALKMGDLIIGSSGDFGPAFIVALDVATGAEIWRDRTFARAQMVDANGTLVIVDESGEIAVASVSRAGLQVHARKPLLSSSAWTPPTLVGSTLYVRDRKEILALDLNHPADEADKVGQVSPAGGVDGAPAHTASAGAIHR